MRNTMHRYGALAVLLGLCLGAVPAFASDAELAQSLFDEAQKLRGRGRYEEACPKLEESQRLDPAIGTLLYLADCYEQTGRLGKAWRTFDRAEREARGDGQEARAQAAADAKTAMDPKTGKISIVAAGSRSEVTVWLDSERLSPEQWSEPVRVEPGEHTVEAGTDAPVWLRKVEIDSPAASKRVTLPDFSARSTPNEAPDESINWEAQRVSAVVAGSVSVVALGIGIALGVNSKSVYDDSEAYCIENVCQAEGLAIRDDAYAQATGADVCLVLSAVALTTGVVLWLTAPDGGVEDVDADEPASGDAEVTARVGPAGGALTVRW